MVCDMGKKFYYYYYFFKFGRPMLIVEAEIGVNNIKYFNKIKYIHALI